MEYQYIIPVVGQTYINRGGGEYLCTDNWSYVDDELRQKALALGEHRTCLKRVTDGWNFVAYGVIQYKDGTIEWNYSAHGNFPYR